MMQINNVIAQCANKNGRLLDPAQIRYLVIHHCSLSKKAPGNDNPIPDDKLTGPLLAKAFKDLRLGTTGCTPYHFLITYTGIDQLLQLSVRGAHARAWNDRSIGIAVVADEDNKVPPLQSQRDNLIALLRVLYPINGGLEIVGHTQLAGASADPHKVCPGPLLNPDQLSAETISLAAVLYHGIVI